MSATEFDEAAAPPTQVDEERIRHLHKDGGNLVLYDKENGQSWLESDTTVEDWFDDGR